VPSYLRALDVIVLPSVSRPNWAEQFGRILVEAMAAGVSVVGSNCGEIPDVIGNAGLVFPEGDANALARILDRLARQPSLRVQLGERGRRRALERYTYRRIAMDTVEVYRQVLHRNSAQARFGVSASTTPARIDEY
jgi:glycosyltransferase involved in cell wall biosynthesis